MDWWNQLATAYSGFSTSMQDFALVSHFFKPEMQADIGEWLVKIAIVWVLMGRRVSEWAKTIQKNLQTGINSALNTFSEHTKAIEGQLQNVVKEVRELKDAVAKDLGQHSKDIGELKADVNNIKTRLNKVEQPKG